MSTHSFKYLCITKGVTNQILSSYFKESQDQDYNQIQNQLEKIRKNNLLKNQFVQNDESKLTSNFGEWMIFTDQKFSYFLLCKQSASPLIAKQFVAQLKQNLSICKQENYKTQIIQKQKNKIDLEIKNLIKKYQKKINLSNVKDTDNLSSKVENIIGYQSSQSLYIPKQVQQVKVNSQFQIPMKSQTKLVNNNESTSNLSQNQRTIEANKMTTKDKIIIAVVAIIAILIMIALAIVLPLTIRSYQPSSSDRCANYKNLCINVSIQTQDYIFANYQIPNQIAALLQAAQKLSVGTSDDQFKAMECLTYVLRENAAEGFANIRDITLSTFSQLKAYLAGFNASTSISTLSAVSSNSCQLFTVTSLQNININKNNLKVSNRLLADACITDTTLFYLDGFAASNYRRASNLNAMRRLIQSDPDIDIKQYKYKGSFEITSSVWEQFATVLNNFLVQSGTSLTQIQLYRVIISYLDNVASKKLKQIPNWETIMTTTLQQMATYMRNTMNTAASDNFTVHATDFANIVNQGKKLLVASHTFGSYFSQRSYRTLSSTNKLNIGLIYIAGAANSFLNKVSGTTNYVINPSDEFLNYFRSNFYPQPLNGNVDSKSFTTGVGYCFNDCVEGYIKYYPTQILNALKTQKGNLCNILV